MGRLPVALTIAGLDPSGGAGVAADLKTFTALEVYGAAALTVVTVQDTRGVRSLQPLDPNLVVEQVRAVVDDLGVDAVKTGALGSKAIVEAVAGYLKAIDAPLVVDPVTAAAAGGSLLEPDALETLKRRLIPLAKIITPNRFEAELLTGVKVVDVESAIEAAKRIVRELGAEAAVVKGGHLPGDAVDVLYYEGSVRILRAPRIETRCLHGAGCTFSAAITAELAKGRSLVEAVETAKRIVTLAIEYAVEVGHGNCPVNPSAWIHLAAERMWALEDVEEALNTLLLKQEMVARYAPEVGMNIVKAVHPHYARSVEDVAAIEGRIVHIARRRLRPAGPPKMGASSHLARLVLSLMKRFPQVRAAVNIAYHPKLVEAAEKLGYRVMRVERRLEPTRHVEGSTMQWIASVASREDQPPDVIYDEGDVGKEPMIRILGRTAKEAVEKLLNIVENATRS